MKPIFATTQISRLWSPIVLSIEICICLDFESSIDNFTAVDSGIVCWHSWHLTAEVDATEMVNAPWENSSSRQPTTRCLYLIWLVTLVLVVDLPTPKHEITDFVTLHFTHFTYYLIETRPNTWVLSRHYDWKALFLFSTRRQIISTAKQTRTQIGPVATCERGLVRGNACRVLTKCFARFYEQI